MSATLLHQIDTIRQGTTVELSGSVVEVRGLAVRVSDLPVPVSSTVRIATGRGRGPVLEGEVIGFDREQTLIMPYGATSGIRRGDRVIADQFAQFVRVGDSLLGRVLDGLGRPIDGKPMPTDTMLRSLRPDPVDPMDRPLIDTPLATGVRAVDGMLSVGRGQRLGIFAAPGVGKSTLLGTMVRHTSADISVIALVGERGREVRDFIENQLGEEGLRRSVVVCATGDEAAPVRLRAALVANTIAEYFRDQGKDVLLIMDSVTRFCQAQRQIGLAAGEPPATKGYPPSVFSLLPTLLERSGRTTKGSITGLYAVLVEGDDMNEPIADAARGILDGHVVLSRALASKGHWPAIDVLESISRVSDEVIEADHQAARRQVLRLINAYRQVEDLLNIGAYPAGSNPDFDLAIACKASIDQFLQQGREEVKGIADFEKTRKQVVALTHQFAAARKQVDRLTQRGAGQPPARR